VRQAFRDTLGLSIYNQLGGAENLREAAVDYYVGSQARGAARWLAHGCFCQGGEGDVRCHDARRWIVAGRIGYGSGAPVELPPRWNESEFDQRLSRYDFAGAGARYANGQPAQKADVLANYQLLLDHAAPDGTHFYKLVDRAGRPLIAVAVMCSGFLFRRGPLMPAPIPYSQRGGTRSDVAPAPPPPDVGWMDGISASFRASVYDQPGYMDGQRRVAYQSLLDAIQPYAATPLAEARGQSSVLSVRDMQAVGAALNTGRNDQAYDLIWKLAGRVRASNPKALHGIAESREAFDRAWQGDMRARQERDYATVRRTSTVPWLVGSLAGGMVDPVNLMTLPLGGGDGPCCAHGPRSHRECRHRGRRAALRESRAACAGAPGNDAGRARGRGRLCRGGRGGAAGGHGGRREGDRGGHRYR
jgi:hypothetical protein